MKKTSIILLFIVLFCTVNAQTKTYYHTNGKLKDIGFYDKQGYKIGEWKYYFATGDLEKTEAYKNGQITAIKYYYKGNLRGEEYFENGKKTGEWKYYNQQTGKLKRIDHYQNGKPVGVSKWYHKNGELGEIWHYENGKSNGEHIIYYPLGKIKTVEVFDEGKITETKSYYENGVLGTTKYLKGKKIIVKNFYNDGSLATIGCFTNFKNGQKIGKHKYYHQNGRLLHKIKYSDTKRTKSKGYYANGKRKFKGYKIMVEHDGNKSMEATGKWKFYYKTGKLSSIGNFLNGNKIGEWKVYLENGELDKIEHYKNGMLDGKIQYFELGKLISQGIYEQNHKIGGTFYINKTFLNFYKNGKLVSSTYHFGNYKMVDFFENHLITKVITYKNNTIIYEGDFKNGVEFNGDFITIDNKENPKKYTLTPYKNGLKHGTEQTFNLIDNKIEETHTYKAGVLVKKD